MCKVCIKHALCMCVVLCICGVCGCARVCVCVFTNVYVVKFFSNHYKITLISMLKCCIHTCECCGLSVSSGANRVVMQLTTDKLGSLQCRPIQYNSGRKQCNTVITVVLLMW